MAIPQTPHLRGSTLRLFFGCCGSGGTGGGGPRTSVLVGSDSGTSASPAAPMALVSAAAGVALFISVGNSNIRRLPTLVGRKENKENMTETVPVACPTRCSLGVCNARLDSGGTRRGLAMLALVCARAVIGRHVS